MIRKILGIIMVIAIVLSVAAPIVYMIRADANSVSHSDIIIRVLCLMAFSFVLSAGCMALMLMGCIKPLFDDQRTHQIGGKMSDEIKHTPGPWEVKEVKTSCGRAFKINELGIDTGHGCIACIYDDSTTLNERPHEEHTANAHLIAAAPDLLAACKAFIDDPRDLAEHYKTMFEAIAQAEPK